MRSGSITNASTTIARHTICRMRFLVPARSVSRMEKRPQPQNNASSGCRWYTYRSDLYGEITAITRNAASAGTVISLTSPGISVVPRNLPGSQRCPSFVRVSTAIMPAPTAKPTMLQPISSSGPLGYCARSSRLFAVDSSETVSCECSCAYQHGKVSSIPPTPASAGSENAAAFFHSRRNIR